MIINSSLNGTERPVLRLNQLHTMIDKHIQISSIRYLDTEHFTGGPIEFLVDLLKWLKNDDILYRDMLDVYDRYIEDDIPILVSKFDIVGRRAKPKRNNFFKGVETEEILIPTYGILGTEATVLDTWKVWKHVAPIKILDHDSTELKVYWQHQIKFDIQKPSYAIIGIDVGALLVKYIVYLRENGYTFLHDNMQIHQFINREIIPFFYRDLVDIWMNKWLKALTFSIPEEFEFVSKDFQIRSLFDTAHTELTEVYDKYIRGNYRIGDLLRTKFYLNGRSILDMFEIYEDIYSCELDRRYLGYELVKLRDILGFVCCALNDTRDRGLETSIIRKILYQARMYSMSAWESHVYNITLKYLGMSLIAEMQQLDS